MATRLYSQAPGNNLEDIVEAAGPATTTRSIELNVDLAALATIYGSNTAEGKRQVLLALVQFAEYIIRSNWPPA